jgi:hypothetical protein
MVEISRGEMLVLQGELKNDRGRNLQNLDFAVAGTIVHFLLLSCRHNHRSRPWC